MSEPLQIVGSYLSPYVRKVLVALSRKGIDYRIDPIIPFMGNDEFGELSPIRRVPVLVDDLVRLCDSTVICQYLEERWPRPALFPTDIADRARARWLEEFADTRMGEVIIWRLFNQVAINPFVWGRPTDQVVVERAVSEELPAILDYLESQVGEGEYLFGEPSIADFSIASFFRNAEFARYRIDAQRWPRTAALVARVLELDCFSRLRPFEDVLMRTAPAEHRRALGELGAPLSDQTYATSAPRRGVMQI
jgi:glutathione S-transferase